MPMHDFECGDCGKRIQDTTSKGIHKCPVCDTDMRWDCRVHVRGNYERPIHSDALAINPNQKLEHEKMFPNIRLDDECRPIFDNYTDHEAYLKKCNMVKMPQKIRPHRTETKSKKATVK